MGTPVSTTQEAVLGCAAGIICAIVSLVFSCLTGEDQESARRSAALAVAVAVVVIVEVKE